MHSVMRSFSIASTATAPPRMDTMIGVSAALAILESSTDTESSHRRFCNAPHWQTGSAPWWGQRKAPHLHRHSHSSCMCRHRPRTAGNAGTAGTADARHCSARLRWRPSLCAHRARRSVPSAPPAQQLQQAPHRPDFWEEHWSQPRTAWADEVDDEWELKGAGKRSKGGKGRRVHYDDFNAQRAPHASQWEKGWALQGKGAQHWEKGAPQAPPAPPAQMQPSTQVPESQIKWSVLGRPLYRNTRGNWACAWACTRTVCRHGCPACGFTVRDPLHDVHAAHACSFCMKDDQED